MGKKRKDLKLTKAKIHMNLSLLPLHQETNREDSKKCGMGWVQRGEYRTPRKEKAKERLWKSRPKGTTDSGKGVRRQLFSTQEINLHHGSSAPSKQRQGWTTSAATTPLSKRLAQLQEVGRDCPTEHQQRPLQSQGETLTTKARDSLDAVRARAGGGTHKSRRKQRTQTRGGGGPSEWEAEAQSAVIPSAQ